MKLEARETKSGQKVYGTYDFKNGKIAFRQNDKSDKFSIVYTRPNNSQTSLKSIGESEIEAEFTALTLLDNLSKSPVHFETNFKNINSSKDGEFAIYGLSREQFFDVMEYLR